MPQRRGDNAHTTFGRPPKKIVRAQRTSKFRQLSTLIANISGMDRHIEHVRKPWSATTPSTLGEKILVNFGPQTKKFYWLILTNPRRYFSGDYILAIRGCCTLKFLYALEIDQGYLAHTPIWTGVPPKKLWSWKCKIWLKIQRIRVNKFGTNGDIITNFYPDDVPRARGYNLRTFFGRPAP